MRDSNVPKFIAPEVGAIVEFRKDHFGTHPARYRVNAYLCEVHIYNNDMLSGQTVQQSGRTLQLQWCLRSQATHLSLADIGSTIAPINECLVVGMVNWGPTQLSQIREEAYRKGLQRQQIRIAVVKG